MKYLIACDGTDLGSKLSRRFGNAGYHLLIDTEKMEAVRSEEGDVSEMPEHGMNRFAAFKGLDGVITWNIGPHAFEAINNMNIPVYVVRNTTVGEALERVMNGEVEARDKPTMKRCHNHDDEDRHHGHGHGNGQGRGLGKGRRHGKF